MNILKDAIDMADTGQRGASINAYPENFDADAIGGPEILNDLVAIASR